MAMPAMTANAENRLPLTPQRGRKNLKYRPRLPNVKRTAMLSPPATFVRFKNNWSAVSRYRVNKIAKI